MIGDQVTTVVVLVDAGEGNIHGSTIGRAGPLRARFFCHSEELGSAHLGINVREGAVVGSQSDLCSAPYLYGGVTLL
jgi:hypothetical protein